MGDILIAHFWVCDASPHCLNNIFISNFMHHHFWPKLLQELGYLLWFMLHNLGFALLFTITNNKMMKKWVDYVKIKLHLNWNSIEKKWDANWCTKYWKHVCHFHHSWLWCWEKITLKKNLPISFKICFKLKFIFIRWNYKCIFNLFILYQFWCYHWDLISCFSS